MSKKPVVKPKTIKTDTRASSNKSNKTAKDEEETVALSQQNLDQDEEFARQLQVIYLQMVLLWELEVAFMVYFVKFSFT